MSLRYSTGLIQEVANSVSWRRALANGRLKLFTGVQPASADQAHTGTLLGTFTLNGLPYTGETKAKASILLGGASGSINTLLVAGVDILNGPVLFTTNLTTTAAAVVAAINSYPNMFGIKAESSGSTVTLTAPSGAGAKFNTISVSATSTVMTTSINGGSSSVFGGAGSPATGVTAVNGLNFEQAVAGAIAKGAAVWKATGVATGAIGCFRLEIDPLDDQLLSTTFKRVDGSVATSGSDLNVGSVNIVTGGEIIVTQFKLATPNSLT
jgi:hypothetical protein